MDKEAAYKEAFLKRMMDAVSATAPKRYKALEQVNNSMITGSVLKTLRERKVPGAVALNDTTNWIRRRISDVDTGVGALLAGKNWHEGKGIRTNMFTDYKENLYETGPDTYKRFRTPSATAPIKTLFGNYVVPFWAMSKAFEIKDSLTDKQEDPYQYQGQGVEYERSVN